MLVLCQAGAVLDAGTRAKKKMKISEFMRLTHSWEGDIIRDIRQIVPLPMLQVQMAPELNGLK